MERKISFKSLLIEVAVLFCLIILTFKLGNRTFIKNEDNTSVRKIIVQLKPPIDERYAGELIAEYLGYYKDENLVVEFKIVESDLIVKEPILSSICYVGIDNSYTIAQKRCNGESVKAVSIDFDYPPIGWIVKTKSKYKECIDFKKGRVAKRINDIGSEFLLESICKRIGIDYSEINFVLVEDGFKEFEDDKIDILPVNLLSDEIILKNKGYAVKTLTPNEYDIKPYGQVIYASDFYIAKSRDIISRFVRAKSFGWEYINNHNADLVVSILKSKCEYFTTSDSINLKDRIQRIKELNIINKLEMNSSRWNSIIFLLKKNEKIGPFCEPNVCYHNL